MCMHSYYITSPSGDLYISKLAWERGYDIKMSIIKKKKAFMKLSLEYSLACIVSSPALTESGNETHTHV